MKTFPTFCLAFLLAVSLQAQQAAPQPPAPPLPAGPLLKRTADYAAWTVTYQGHPIEEKQPVKPSTTGEEKPVEKRAKELVTTLSSVVKTGSTILEQNVDAAGQRHQIWHVSGNRIATGVSKPVVFPDYASADIYSINFASADFAGFSWISPTTYAGIVKYQGNDCLVFKGTVSPLGAKAQLDEKTYIREARGLGLSVPDALAVATVAYIDLETRLPVFAQFGEEKRFYRYGAPPTEPLVLPPELEGAVKEYMQKMMRLSAPAVRAY